MNINDQATKRPDAPAEPRNEVVVGIDDSPESAAALRWAAEQSKVSGTPLRLVHTWQISATASAAVISGGRRVPRGRSRRRAGAGDAMGARHPRRRRSAGALDPGGARGRCRTGAGREGTRRPDARRRHPRAHRPSSSGVRLGEPLRARPRRRAGRRGSVGTGRRAGGAQRARCPGGATAVTRLRDQGHRNPGTRRLPRPLTQKQPGTASPALDALPANPAGKRPTCEGGGCPA